ncbi:aminotransferase class I/II-fold pyridoxal phosphate-dependent enzyme [Dysgonomonas termitidis]|uniref:Aminotransferase class I/II-fold pyridoxal phosphate-dependent enzyme n=1 Tax=Dysgonomonas termitidis TaxID=1516126 RepID=A0ABV9L1D2_9BACT
MQELDIVEKLAEKLAYLREKLKKRGFNILNSVTAVVPVIVGEVYKLTSLSKELLDEMNIFFLLFPQSVPDKS